MNDFLSAVESFELNSKRTVFRAIANSAIFRLFGVIDRLESLQAALDAPVRAKDPSLQSDIELKEELQGKAVHYRRLYNSCARHLRTLGGGDFWEPMDGYTVLEFMGTVKEAEVDLCLLAEISGVGRETLEKMQKAELIAEARKGRARVARSGDIFLNFLEEDTEVLTDDIESLMDELNMDGREIALRGLKKAMDRALKNALRGDQSGLSDLIFYKDAVYALS